ncbi:MAG: recombinase, partial [Anaerolineae bacterium]|nr:recombinase [Anaerolineae bacterium]
MDRVRTGIPGFDELLGGGFLPQSANLVEGAPGTGKSTLGMQ